MSTFDKKLESSVGIAHVLHRKSEMLLDTSYIDSNIYFKKKKADKPIAGCQVA